MKQVSNKADLLRELKAAYGVVRPGEVGDTKWMEWLRGWDRYCTLLEADKAVRDEVLGMCLKLVDLRGAGAVLVLEVVCAVLETLPMLRFREAVADVWSDQEKSPFHFIQA